MPYHYDDAQEIAQTNESGAARCVLADKVELLVSDRGDRFEIWDFRPFAKRELKVVGPVWAHRFLSAAANVRVESVEW